MLTLQEAENTYSALDQIIRRANLGYVADQVAFQIRLGKAETKKVQIEAISAETNSEVPTTRRRRKGKTEVFTESVEFSSLEKLNLLVRAIERATIEVAELHSDTAQLLDKAIHNRPDSAAGVEGLSFQFVDESSSALVISNAEIRTRFSAECSSLAQLLNEVKEQLHAP